MAYTKSIILSANFLRITYVLLSFSIISIKLGTIDLGNQRKSYRLLENFLELWRMSIGLYSQNVFGMFSTLETKSLQLPNISSVTSVLLIEKILNTFLLFFFLSNKDVSKELLAIQKKLKKIIPLMF